MPLRYPRVALAALTVAGTAVALTACGSDSSSGPTPLTAAQAAVHYDSLVGPLYAAGTVSDSLQAALIQIISGAAADGATPANASVTLDGHTATWYATFVNLVDSAQNDSAQIVALWSDLNVDDIAVALFSNGQINAILSLSAGGDVNSDSTGTGTIALGAASGTCTFTSIVNTTDPLFVPTYDPTGSTCLPQSVSASATATFPTDTTTTGSIQSLSFTLRNVAGARLLADSSSPAVPSRVPARIRALLGRRLTSTPASATSSRP